MFYSEHFATGIVAAQNETFDNEISIHRSDSLE